MWVPMKFDFPFWWLIKLFFEQQLDKVPQNMVIYEWGEDQLFSKAERLRQIIDLWDAAEKHIYMDKCVIQPIFLGSH